jgi:hypothetical protein
VVPTEDGATDLVLRPGTAADLEEIVELFLATRRDAVPQMPPVLGADEEIRAWFREHAGTRELWVAEDGEYVEFESNYPDDLQRALDLIRDLH